MEEMIFALGSVPVAVVARVYGKDASWVRAGIISGWLPIGKATRNGKLITNIEEMNSKYGRINFYISPKRLWEETGYLWREALIWERRFVQNYPRKIHIGLSATATIN